MQLGHALHALQQAFLGQPVALLVLELDIVVVASPIVTKEYQLRSPPELPNGSSLKVTANALMEVL
jgi:hypothetical protein